MRIYGLSFAAWNAIVAGGIAAYAVIVIRHGTSRK
jgi:hypothetical protein